jgi:small nuclear ribonucleoprotein D3
MQTAVLTDRDGKTSTLEHVYLRGSQIRFVIIPDMFVNAPMFKQNQAKAAESAAAAAAGLGARDAAHVAKKPRTA